MCWMQEHTQRKWLDCDFLLRGTACHDRAVQPPLTHADGKSSANVLLFPNLSIKYRSRTKKMWTGPPSVPPSWSATGAHKVWIPLFFFFLFQVIVSSIQWPCLSMCIHDRSKSLSSAFVSKSFLAASLLKSVQTRTNAHGSKLANYLSSIGCIFFRRSCPHLPSCLNRRILRASPVSVLLLLVQAHKCCANTHCWCTSTETLPAIHPQAASTLVTIAAVSTCNEAGISPKSAALHAFQHP